MTRHHTLPRFTAAAALGLVLLSACSSTSNSGEVTAATTSTAAATSVPSTSTIDEVAAPSTTAPAPSTTATPATTATTAAPSTLPPGPPPTIAPNIAPPPAVCVTPGVESEPVELVITDNGVLFNGAPAPDCMRVPESFRFRFTNNAEGDATVTFGDGVGTVFAGNSELTDPLGEIFFVGDEFQITIAELATVIDVTVIA